MNNSVSFLKLAFHTLVFEKWQSNISFFKIKDKDLVLLMFLLTVLFSNPWK